MEDRASFEDHPLSEQATEYQMTALDLARAKQSAMREQGIVIKKRDPYQIAAADPKSLRKAVNAIGIRAYAAFRRFRTGSIGISSVRVSPGVLSR